MSLEQNGAWKKLESIQSDVKEIKDELSHSIDKLSLSVDKLAAKFDSFISVAQNSLPIKAVVWLMSIMVLGLVGIEGVKGIAPVLHYWLGLP